jgi:hypothetical protein
MVSWFLILHAKKWLVSGFLFYTHSSPFEVIKNLLKLKKLRLLLSLESLNCFIPLQWVLHPVPLDAIANPLFFSHHLTKNKRKVAVQNRSNRKKRDGNKNFNRIGSVVLILGFYFKKLLCAQK